MDFYISKARLEPELSRITAILARKSPLPILDNVLIKSSEGKEVEFGASNLETTLTTKAVADQIVSYGSLCLPARRLYDSVRLLPEGIIHFEGSDNNHCKITCLRSNYKIPGADPGDFIPLPSLAEEPILKFPAKLLKHLINGVKYAIAPDGESRYATAGMRFEADGDGVRAVATDGHRLALAIGAVEELQFEDISVTITPKTLEDLGKLIADSEEDVGVVVEENNMHMVVGARHLSGRLLAGEFPKYQMIMDSASQGNTDIVFNRPELVMALKRAAQAADAQSQSLLFEFSTGKLTLSAKTAQTGESREILEGLDYSGPDVAVSYSARYLLDFLEAMDSAQVTLGIKLVPNKPVYVHCTSAGISYSSTIGAVRSGVA